MKAIVAVLLLFLVGCATTGVQTHPAYDPEHFHSKAHYEVIKLQDVEMLGITTRHDVIRYCPGGGKPCEMLSIQSYARPGVLEIFGPPVIHGLAQTFQYRFINWGGDNRIGPEFYNVNQQSQEQSQEQEQGQYQKVIKKVPKKWRSPGWGAK